MSIPTRRAVLATLGASALGAGGLAVPARAQQRLTIGAVMYARDSQYWQQIERGMKDAAAQYGATVQVVLNRRQLPTEAQVIDDLLTRGIDALVVSPLDKDASAASIGRVKARGIPVIEYNTFLADKSIAAHNVGVDNVELGSAVGAVMKSQIIAELGGSATIGIITLPLINPGSAVRKDGLLAGLAGAKYTVVGELAGATPEEGANHFENLLQKNPAIQMVWCSSAGTLAGAANAAKRSASKARLFGVDMSQELAEMLLDPAGFVQAVSDQQPYRMGFMALETAVKEKRGEAQPRDITLPVKVYTRQDPPGVRAYLDLVKSLST